MLIMENPEEILQMLERYTKFKPKVIPRELEDYLFFVAKTGDTVYRWPVIKYLFREKLILVIKNLHESSPSDLPQYPNVDPFNYDTMKNALLERFESFHSAPFTIQRLAELITNPRKQYSRIDKFMRAIEKNILVVSTTEPGRKRSDSENNDSIDSVINGDSVDVNVDINMDTESIIDCCRPTKESTKDNETDREHVSASTVADAAGATTTTTSDGNVWPHSYNFKTANKETNTGEDVPNSSSAQNDVEGGQADAPEIKDSKSEITISSETPTTSDEIKTKIDKEKTDPDSILAKFYQPKEDDAIADSALKEDEKKILIDETGGKDNLMKMVAVDTASVSGDSEIDKTLDDDGKTEAKKKKLSNDIDIGGCSDVSAVETKVGDGHQISITAVDKDVEPELTTEDVSTPSTSDENKTNAKESSSCLESTTQTEDLVPNEQSTVATISLPDKVTADVEEKDMSLDDVVNSNSDIIPTKAETTITTTSKSTETIPIPKDDVVVDMSAEVNIKTIDTPEKSENEIDDNKLPADSKTPLDICNVENDDEKNEDTEEKKARYARYVMECTMREMRILLNKSDDKAIDTSDNDIAKSENNVSIGTVFSAVNVTTTTGIDKNDEMPTEMSSTSITTAITTTSGGTNLNEIFMENSDDGESSGEATIDQAIPSPAVTIMESSSSNIQEVIKMSTEDDDDDASIIISETTTGTAITTIVTTNTDNAGEMEVDENVGVEPMDQ